MRMRRLAVAAGLLLACSGAIAGEPESLDFNVSAQVDVDVTGKAHVLEMGKVSRLSDVPSLAPVAETIAQRLRQRIETWQFTPAARLGQPVASTTNVHVALEGSDDGHGGLAVRILNARTGGDLRDPNRLALTIALNRAQEEAVIAVGVEYDESGHVQSLSEVDARGFRHGKFVGTPGKSLRKDVLAAARDWTFVPEKIEGHPIVGRGVVPVRLCFSAECTSAPYIRERGDDGRDGSDAGTSFAAVDPAVTLRSAVAGTAQ